MKKLASGLIAAMFIFAGISALASDEQDVYFGSDNSVHFTDDNSRVSNYTTVLIRRSGTTGADGVVYVDQRSEGFSDVIDFMLKADAEQGSYTATFGNSNNETRTIDFTVGSISIAGEESTLTLDHTNKMSVIDEPELQEGLYGGEANGTYKKGFTFTATSEQYNAFNRLYLVSADGKTCYGYFEIEKETTVTEGEVAYGMQVYNIPEEQKGMNLYLGEASEQ